MSPTPSAAGTASADLKSAASVARRDGSHQTRDHALIITSVILVAGLCITLSTYFLFRTLRARGYKPKYIPSQYLKKKWYAWIPSSEKRRSLSALQDRRSIQQLRSSTPISILLDSQPASTTPAERRTSVRSIATLPAYSANIRPTEQLMGRAGDRAGVDTVVEFPESQDEEEARREAEMASLYNIRQTRRDEAASRRAARAERSERRRLIREARARGDAATVAALQHENQQSLQRADTQALASPAASEALIEEHRTRGRERRVSSVAYAALGVARHDGSRVRSDSASSDNRPLLDNAAGMGGGDHRSRDRSTSQGTLPLDTYVPVPGQQRGRNTSISSLARFMTPDDVSSDGEQSSNTSFEYISRLPTPPPLHVHDRTRSRSGSGLRQQLRLRVDSSAADHRPVSSESIAAPGQQDETRSPPPNYDNLSPREDAQATEQTPTQERYHQQQQERDQQQREEEDILGTPPVYESPKRAGLGVPRLPSIRITPFSPILGSPDVDGENE